VQKVCTKSGDNKEVAVYLMTAAFFKEYEIAVM